jgi:signal transduction histidine kinase
VRYLLPPGTYTLEIYASRFFDKNAQPLKTIVIIINPPFWKTWWFITGIILLALAILAYSFNRYNKNKYQKKLAVLEAEHKIQLERERISRDLHDSIGAYANAVLYNTELLQKENDVDEKNVLMNDLKFASKDIITSLRETVWALKKETYTAEECLIRIKNFIQALSRYYPYIQFKAEGDASAQTIIHHTKALHIVRIVQEAVTNAVKHGGAGTISLASYQQDEKWLLTVEDNGKGFDYEKMKEAELGNGLINMNQRAKEAGLAFTISSVLGRGTKITIGV